MSWSDVHLFLTLCQAGQVEAAYRRVPDIESKANSWRWVLALGEALRGNHQRAAEVLDAYEEQCRRASDSIAPSRCPSWTMCER
jgi:hypothetical protein